MAEIINVTVLLNRLESIHTAGEDHSTNSSANAAELLFRQFEIMLGFLIKERSFMSDELAREAESIEDLYLAKQSCSHLCDQYKKGELARDAIPGKFNTLVRRCLLALLDAAELNEDENRKRKALVEEINGLASEAEEAVDMNPDINLAPELSNRIKGVIGKINGSGGGGGGGGGSASAAAGGFDYISLRQRAEETLDKDPCRFSQLNDEYLVRNLNDDEPEIVADRLLYGGRQNRSELHVIAIVGDKGSGKTTLARRVYNDAMVKSYYTSRGWVSVSNNHSLRNLLLKILPEFMVDINEDIYEMDEKQLKRQLFEQLKAQRFLLVLDDAQSCDQWWDDIKEAFPSTKGSRIILIGNESYKLPSSLLDVMTFEEPVPDQPDDRRGGDVNIKRFLEYQLACGYSPQYDHKKYDCFGVGGLNEQQRSQLFATISFPQTRSHSHTLKLSQRIVRSLGHSPAKTLLLATILNGGGRNSLRWARIVAQLEKSLYTSSSVSPPTVDEFPSVCYNQIPLHLKPYFLYLSVFPRDTEISVNELLRLWSTEGLKYNGYDSWEHLQALNVLEAIPGYKKSCRINGLLWEFCVDMSLKESFVEVLAPGRQGSLKVIDESTRKKPTRLSIHAKLEECISDFLSTEDPNYDSSFRHVRSFSCFSQDAKNVSKDDWASLLEKFPLLKVLNIAQGEVGKLSKEAFLQLSHLTYLKIAKTVGVPKSIFKLWKLQIIDLRTCRFDELPKDIWQMKKLEQLFIDGPSRLPKADKDDDPDNCCLPELIILSCISVDPDIEISKKAPNLRKLGLYGYRCTSKTEQLSTFNLPKLQSLKFREQCAFQVPIQFPATLTTIKVSKAPLKPEVIKMFGKLRELHTLKLVQTSFDDDQLVFGENSFPKLVSLKFKDSNLVSWKLERGAIPNLASLVIIKCSLLTEPPPGLLQERAKLNKLELIRTSTRFVAKLNDEARNLKREDLKMEIYPPLRPAAKA